MKLVSDLLSLLTQYGRIVRMAAKEYEKVSLSDLRPEAKRKKERKKE